MVEVVPVENNLNILIEFKRNREFKIFLTVKKISDYFDYLSGMKTVRNYNYMHISYTRTYAGHNLEYFQMHTTRFKQNFVGMKIMANKNLKLF